MERIPVFSNAEVARIVAESDDDTLAAVAGVTAVEIYRLSMAAKCVEDEPSNITRLLAFGHQGTVSTGSDETPLIVSVPNKAGMATSLLWPSTDLDIPITEFKGHPSKSAMREYLFLTDIEGHEDGGNIQAALKLSDRRASLVEVAGFYPTVVL